MCDVDWNYIIHYEHMQEELDYVLRQFGEKTRLPSHSSYYEKKQNANISSSSLTLKYMEQLPLATISELYKIYEEDFRMFNFV